MILIATVYHRILRNAVVASSLDTVCKPWSRLSGEIRLQFGEDVTFSRDRCRSGRAALALTFSMVPRTRHTKGEQNTPLLLPPKPNRGKANLLSRIRTIEKSPRRTRPFARAPQLPQSPIKAKIAKPSRFLGAVPKNFHKLRMFRFRFLHHPS